MGEGAERHELNVRNNHGVILLSIRKLHAALTWTQAAHVAVADVVHVITTADDGLDGVDEFRCTLLHAMDVEQRHCAWLVVNHVVERKVNQEVVVGVAPLKERLATLDILAECGHRVPLRVVRSHIHARIETPAGPFGFFGRIAGTMEEYVVHSRHEHQVEVGLALAQRCAEMFGKPCEGLARRVGLAGEMGTRRRIFQHRQVGEVFLREAGVGAQAFDAKVAQAETFAFRNIHSCIEVNQVGWRTMCLIAREGSVCIGPAGPLLREVGEQHLAQGLAVVGEHTLAGVGAERVGGDEEVELLFQLIAPAFGKLTQKGGGPVGAINLVGVVEEGVGTGSVMTDEGGGDAGQIAAHGLFVEVVDHVALSAGSGTLHHLLRAARIEHDEPTACRRIRHRWHVHYHALAVTSHFRTQVHHRHLILEEHGTCQLRF